MRQFTIASSAGSLVFNSGAADGDGAFLSSPPIDGWDGSDVSVSLSPRAGAIGMFATDVHAGARTLSIKQAVVAAPSEGARTAVRDRISAVLMTMANIDGFGTLSVVETTLSGSRTLSLPICLNGKPIMLELDPMPVMLQGEPLGVYWPLQVTIVMIAPDPLKLKTETSWSIVDGVTHVVVAEGTAPTMPRLSLSPAGDVNLNHSELGRTVLLSSGSMPGLVVIDLADHSVVDGSGNNRFDIVQSPPSQWWPILPGNNTITITGAAGTGFYSPAWW